MPLLFLAEHLLEDHLARLAIADERVSKRQPRQPEQGGVHNGIQSDEEDRGALANDICGQEVQQVRAIDAEM